MPRWTVELLSRNNGVIYSQSTRAGGGLWQQECGGRQCGGARAACKERTGEVLLDVAACRAAFPSALPLSCFLVRRVGERWPRPTALEEPQGSQRGGQAGLCLEPLEGSRRCPIPECQLRKCTVSQASRGARKPRIGAGTPDCPAWFLWTTSCCGCGGTLALASQMVHVCTSRLAFTAEAVRNQGRRERSFQWLCLWGENERCMVT